MKERKLMLLIFSHALIGVGFFFLYIYFVRSIFESRTHFSTLSQLERESMLRKEDALYFTFYKTIVSEPSFLQGFERLLNMTQIEYPNRVNVVQTFHVLPELVIGYLFHGVRRVSRQLEIPILTCWTMDENTVAQPQITCEGLGEPHQFYLEVVWVLGGLTVFIMYMYSAFLSENMFGGIYAVVSYIMFHKNASKIYERPVARENFAFPFILWQIFYLCLCIERTSREKDNNNKQTFRPVMILKLTILTTISLLCWQFSSIIFATQILIMITPWSLGVVSSSFAIDYSISQFLSNILAFVLSFGNKKYFFAWQNGPALTLFFISIARLNNSTARSQSSLKSIMLGILMAISSQGSIIDLLEKSGYAMAADNPFTVYRDLILHWGLQRRVTFATSLLACDSEFYEKEVTDLWQLLETMFVKPYCLYGVVVLTKFFRKWRQKNAPPKNADHMERAMKYVLEDFLEENHITMQEINNVGTRKELIECWYLLSRVNYDYEKYKLEKTKTTKDKDDEHDAFIKDIKKLKQQINANSKQKKKDEEARSSSDKIFDCKEEKVAAAVEVETEQCQKSATKDRLHLSDESEDTHKNEQKNASLERDKDKKSDEHGEKKTPLISDLTANIFENYLKLQTNLEQNANENKTTSSQQEEQQEEPQRSANNNTTAPSSSTSSSTTHANFTSKYGEFLSYHYLYSVAQFAIFAVIGLSIRKLFFLCYTLGCVIAPTLCCKFWYQKERQIFWTISLSVFVMSIINPGLMNVHDEYFPTKASTESLESMLEWINMNTEKDAVFAGPIDIIGTVHLVTRRPIVNNAHLESRQISQRTEHIYSVFSRQQSSDIYNQCSQLKIQYLIIAFADCGQQANDDCDILTIWDEIQPAYRKYPQFCSELLNKNIPSFLKVYSNDQYAIIKMFSQSLQINLKYSKMPEKFM